MKIPAYSTAARCLQISARTRMVSIIPAKVSKEQGEVEEE